MHDYIQSLGTNPFNETFLHQSPKLPKSAKKQPIRISFDYSSITNQKDVSMCTKIGQEVEWHGKKFICNEADILTESKFNVVKQTISNIETFLKNLLKVIPETNEIQLHPIRDILCDISSFSSDLVISISSRPFSANSKHLAASFTHKVSEITGRPIIGGIYLNPFYVPDAPQNITSFNRLYFNVLLHEIVHILGFSLIAMKYWLDKKSGKPYKEFLNKVRIKKFQKTFYLLTTPKAVEFAVKRFGTERFHDSVPMGIELGNSGSNAISHPESRVYLSELMSGIFGGYSYISNLTLSVLYDTGWYDVNFSMAEPLPWGSGESMLLPPLKSFPNKPPQLSFPSHYLCRPDNKDVYKELINDRNLSQQGENKGQFTNRSPYLCNYDFLSKAYCSPAAPYDCNSNNSFDKEFCKMKKFTNPLKMPLRGDRPEFDYMIFKVPDSSMRCNDESLSNNSVRSPFGEEFGLNSMCAMSNLHSKSSPKNASRLLPRCYTMLCDSRQRLFIYIDNSLNQCHYEGENITFKNFDGFVNCPKPSNICGMKQFLRLPTFEQVIYNDTSVKYKYTMVPPSLLNISPKELKIAAAITLFFILIICLMIFLAIKYPIMIGRKFIPIQDGMNMNDSSLAPDIINYQINQE